jgi:colanic acid/amylovoran biosynthesis glycosyltransferase
MGTVLPVLFIRAPLASWRLWHLEKKGGASYTQIIKCLYLNAHILPYKLNWLHFGFATMAIDREHVAQAIHAKMGVSFRGYDINVYPLKNPACYTRLWKNVNKVHSISNYLIKRARAFGLSDSTAFQIIAPAVTQSFAAKTNFEFGQHLQIVTVARLTWIKGLSIALQAMAQLLKSGIQIHYTVVGEGPDREFLLHEIHELGLTKHVTLAGKFSHADTLIQIQNSDIYLQPSLNEGFCNAVLEAQAMGCLCVASRVGGLLENIEDGVTGWLVEPRNPDALTERIVQLIKLPLIERTAVSTQARQRVASHFQTDKHLLQWKSFYES